MSARLRIAVDARVVAQDTRGIGRYERAILRRLLPRDDVEFTLLDFGPFVSLRRGALARVLGNRRFSIASRVPRDADVVWHPANGTFFASHVPSVVTIHDAVPFRYPDSNLAQREHAQRPFLDSVCTAQRIIAVSEFGKSEIEACFGVPHDCIDVIYHGVDPSFTPGDAQPLPAGIEARRYVLFVGNAQAEPRKNFALLYDAYRRAWPNGDGPPIVIAGAHAPRVPGVIAAGDVGDDLRGAGNESLRALYRGALALALPSYHETFGMPLIEAMACGTPVLASRASCLPEIGGDAAYYLDPHDAGAWADALRTITGDFALRERLHHAGLERATHFDWERSAATHLALFRDVAGGSR